MAIHDIAPAFLKVFYARTGASHVMNLPVVMQGTPTPGVEPSLYCRDATYRTATVCVASFLAEVVKIMGTDMSFTRWEAWSKPNIDSDPEFIHSGTIVGATGTLTGSSIVAGQLVASYRTANGGILKLYLMEANVSPNNVLAPPTFGGTPFDDIDTFILGDENFILGRDGGMPITCIRAMTKTNNALRKKLLVNS